MGCGRIQRRRWGWGSGRRRKGSLGGRLRRKHEWRFRCRLLRREVRERRHRRRRTLRSQRFLKRNKRGGWQSWRLQLCLGLNQCQQRVLHLPAPDLEPLQSATQLRRRRRSNSKPARLGGKISFGSNRRRQHDHDACSLEFDVRWRYRRKTDSRDDEMTTAQHSIYHMTRQQFSISSLIITELHLSPLSLCTTE